MDLPTETPKPPFPTLRLASVDVVTCFVVHRNHTHCLQEARAQGVKFLTIGIGDATDRTELASITGNEAQNVDVIDFNELLSDAFRLDFARSITGLKAI